MTELAGVTRNGVLVSEKEWQTHVESLRKVSSTPDISAELSQAIRVRLEWAGGRRVGVLLSGGLDSALLAMLVKRELPAGLTAYAVGTEGAPDMLSAARAAEALGIPLKSQVYAIDSAAGLCREAVRIIPQKTNPVQVSIGMVVVAAARLALADGCSVLFSGLGAEEIFAGYQRHVDAAQHPGDDPVNEECWRGLSAMWGSDLMRDAALCRSLGFSALTPFLDAGVMAAAMQIPGKEKVRDGHRKWALRKLAEAAGLPAEFAWRRKQAAQYGSGFDRMLLEVARHEGFRNRNEYLESVTGESHHSAALKGSHRDNPSTAGTDGPHANRHGNVFKWADLPRKDSPVV